VAQYAIGLALGGFNYWAKVDAHRCIGEYCWYWGDFFYRKDQNLTFDGIFELFPHPMYVLVVVL
jgi:phosphatidylethanolamine N-methyltransferase